MTRTTHPHGPGFRGSHGTGTFAVATSIREADGSCVYTVSHRIDGFAKPVIDEERASRGSYSVGCANAGPSREIALPSSWPNVGPGPPRRPMRRLKSRCASIRSALGGR